MGRFRDLTGQSFGRLTVLERDGALNSNATWLCRCECGSEKVVRGHALTRGATRSCGCLYRESAGDLNRSHGLTETRTYAAWCQMKARCLNPKIQMYRHYGGRGITVCGRWLESFESFLADIGLCPPGLTLERIDANGNYEPENCRWATRREQQRNRRNNVRLTIGSHTLAVSEWAERTGLPAYTIYRRVQRGWSPERILTTPSQPVGAPRGLPRRP